MGGQKVDTKMTCSITSIREIEVKKGPYQEPLLYYLSNRGGPLQHTQKSWALPGKVHSSLGKRWEIHLINKWEITSSHTINPLAISLFFFY